MIEEKDMLSNRLIGFDIARGIALIGIIWAHIHPRDPVWFYHFANGVAPALFVILSGYFYQRTWTLYKNKYSNAKSLFLKRNIVRGLFFIILGLFLGEFSDGIVVILVQFGFLYILGIPLIFIKDKIKISLALIGFVAVPIASFFLRKLIPATLDISSLSFSRLIGNQLDFFLDLFLTGVYPLVFWLLYFMFGAGLNTIDFLNHKKLFKLGLLSLISSFSIYLFSVFLLSLPSIQNSISNSFFEGAYSFNEIKDIISGGIFGVTPRDGNIEWLLVNVPHSGTPFDLLFTTFVSLSIIISCVLLMSIKSTMLKDFIEFIKIVFAGVGSASLSLYSLHVLMNISFVSFTSNNLGRHYLIIIGLGILIFMLNTRGPLEFTLKKLESIISNKKEKGDS